MAGVHRLMSGRYPPMSGEGARTVGGRWNPPDSFPTLYLGSTLDTVVAEVARGFAAQGRRIEEAVGLVVYDYDVDLRAVLDLRGEASLEVVGLTAADIGAPARRRCQGVGDAAHYVGVEAIFAQSAVGDGYVLAVFTDKQGPDSVITYGLPTQWP